MSYDPCPHGHEPSVCEQCPRADGRVALDRATAQRLAASATTARERALLAVNNQCLLGYEPPSAEEVLDAIEAAGLVVVDAKALAEARAVLVALRDDFLPTDDEQVGYGAFHGSDPRKFTPDPECSTEEERAAHKAACDAWDRGDEVAIRGGCEYREAAVATTGTALVRIQRQTFGLGTYVRRDPQVTEIVERINAAIAAMGGE